MKQLLEKTKLNESQEQQWHRSVYEVGSLDSQSQAAKELQLHRVLVHVNSYRELSNLANTLGEFKTRNAGMLQSSDVRWRGVQKPMENA
jgi:hypothetical protein